MKRGFLVAATLLAFGLSSGAGAEAQEPREVDLAITNTANVRHAKVGQLVTFTSVATNLGPDDVVFFHVDVGEAGAVMNFSGNIFIDCARGVSNDGDSCEYGFLLQPGDTVSQTTTRTILGGDGKWATATACVAPFSIFDVDPNPANNCATARVRIVGKR